MSDYKTIAQLVAEAETHANTQAADRKRAVEYYQGVMIDTPSDKGRSSMVTRDVRATIKKVLPSIIRTILNADEIVEFMPVGEGDEAAADQASDYINFIVIPESEGLTAIHDAIHDALLLRNGLIKWWFEEKRTVKFSQHSGLTEDAMLQLVSEDGIEIVEHSERQGTIEGEGGAQQVMLHDCKIKRTVTEGKTRIAAVPRERFLIHPDAVTLEDSILTGEKTTMRRSDLVALGYDKDRIYELPVAGESDAERQLRRDMVTGGKGDGANAEVDYYDLYVRMDMDGDGIAELRHMCFAGGLTEDNLLSDDECDEVQFADICVMRQPHQWEAISVADDIIDLQRAKTVLFRNSLDNIYWQNNPQPLVQAGVITDMEAVLSPEFGKPITVKQGVDVRGAIGFNQVPFMASNSFAMMEYMDKEAQERTGISDASSGMAPDALQNMTAKASAMIEQAGIGQTELMVKTVAVGLKRMFRGLLRMIIRHQDIPRTVRLRGKWVEVDPRHWNAEMDCTVNTGLGAGTRERDMMMMQHVAGMQEKLFAAFGPNNPFVKPDQVFNSYSKLIEAAGLKTPSLYITDPDPQEVQAMLDAIKNAPSPEQMKAQSQMQIEQAKMQGQAQLKQVDAQVDMAALDKKMQADANKELAQMQADKETEAERRKTDVALKQMEINWQREKLLIEQRAALAPHALDLDDEGQTVNPTMDMMRQTQALLVLLAQQMQAANAPKRVIRDSNGEVVGLEPVALN
jgi:hypothetical protein